MLIGTGESENQKKKIVKSSLDMFLEDKPIKETFVVKPGTKNDWEYIYEGGFFGLKYHKGILQGHVYIKKSGKKTVERSYIGKWFFDEDTRIVTKTKWKISTLDRYSKSNLVHYSNAANQSDVVVPRDYRTRIGGECLRRNRVVETKVWNHIFDSLDKQLEVVYRNITSMK